MNYYSYQGRIQGQDRLEKFDEILQDLIENDPTLFCEINYIGNCAIMLQRKFEIEFNTENYDNFILLRDFICFK